MGELLSEVSETSLSVSLEFLRREIRRSVGGSYACYLALRHDPRLMGRVRRTERRLYWDGLPLSRRVLASLSVYMGQEFRVVVQPSDVESGLWSIAEFTETAAARVGPGVRGPTRPDRELVDKLIQELDADDDLKTLDQLMYDLVERGVSVEGTDRQRQFRLGAALRAVGWTRKRETRDGVRAYYWHAPRWVPGSNLSETMAQWSAVHSDMTAPDDSGLAERIASSTVESTYETRGEMLPEFPEGLERADDPDDLDFVTGDVGIPSVSELEYEAELRRLMAVREEPEPEELQQMLGDPASWEVLKDHARVLRGDVAALSASPTPPSPLDDVVQQVSAACLAAAETLEELHTRIEEGDLDALRLELDAPRPVVTRDLRRGARRLRSGRHHAAMTVTNGLSSLRATARHLAAVEEAYSESIVGLVAEAGCGKTQLAEPVLEDDWVSGDLDPQEDPELEEAEEEQEEDPEHEDDWVTSQDAAPDAQMSSMERVLASLSPAVRRSLGLPVNDGES